MLTILTILFTRKTIVKIVSETNFTNKVQFMHYANAKNME